MSVKFLRRGLSRLRLDAIETRLVALVVSCVVAPAVVQAKPRGIATPNCNGCHDGDPYQGELSLIPSAPLVPGEQGEFTLRITEQDMAVAGYFVTAGGLGALSAGPGNRVLDGGIVHTQPASATDGVAEITFYWTPPMEQGGVDIGVFVVAANGDGTQLGDRPASAAFSYVWGCDGIELYEDIDGDGFGSETGAQSLGCEARAGFAIQADDCNDLWASIHPGASETADGRDENCDGEVDEGIVITTWFIDEDGDGFGYGAGFDSDVAPAGYVGNRGDCDDEDAAISPSAVEVCDGRDNDCNGELDDGKGVSITCGVGLCGRVLEVCDRECTPGAPTVEVCDGLDDDCDGEVDEGVTCPDGTACVDYSCVAVATEPTPPSGELEAGAPVTDASGAADTGTASASVESDSTSSVGTQSTDVTEHCDLPPGADAGASKVISEPDTAGNSARASGCAVQSTRSRKPGADASQYAGISGLAWVLWRRRKRA